MTKVDAHGHHVVGYFSKEKHSEVRAAHARACACANAHTPQRRTLVARAELRARARSRRRARSCRCRPLSPLLHARSRRWATTSRAS
jgi:hypothetical protein